MLYFMIVTFLYLLLRLLYTIFFGGESYFVTETGYVLF